MDAVAAAPERVSLWARAFHRAIPFLSGAALTLAFAPWGIWPLAWVALVPFYLALTPVLPSPPAPLPWIPLRGGRGEPAAEAAPASHENQENRVGAKPGLVLPQAPLSRSGRGAGGEGRTGISTGFLFGLGLFLCGITWMTELGTGWMRVLPWIVLSLIQALPFALLGLVSALLLPRLSPLLRPWVFGALWALCEGLRAWGQISFLWFPLAATQVRALPLVQIISVTGAWGLAFLIAAANGLLAEAWLRWRQEHRLIAARWAAAAAIIPVLLALGGTLAMSGAKSQNEPVWRVAVAQGVVQKSGRYTEEARAEALRVYLDLTRQALAEQPQLVLWPETVVPGQALRDYRLYDTLSGLAQSTQTSLLVGSVDRDEKNKLWNTAVLFNREGGLAGRYDKTLLVPFGEFFPLRRFLGPVFAAYGAGDDDFQHGTLPGVVTVDSGAGGPVKVGVLICYESGYGRLAAANIRNGAQALALLTSDQAFGTSAGPYQHADFSVLRAVETRRYLVRAASTGVSEIVDPWGRIPESLGINKRGYLTGDIRLRNDRTLYARWGDWFLGACLVFVAGTVLVLAKRATKRNRR